MAPPNARNIFYFDHLNPRRAQPGNQVAVIRTDERRVRLLRRTKPRLHSQMYLDASTLKPASATLGEFGWLGNLTHPKQV